jgi:molybdopterin-binding protein
MVFLGPSGCGKTTLLRIIAGLETQDRGTIHQGGVDISRLPPMKRDYGIVFQSYALFPNLTIRDNVAYGLVNRRQARGAIAARVAELLTLVGLPDAGAKYPGQLSGGQQQRIALARALATAPGLLLLDEPLSALDGVARDHVRSELARLLRRLQMPAIIVTHDWVDALSLGDRLHVMSRGVVLQEGNPQEVFARPEHEEVASAVGMENLVVGRVQERVSDVMKLLVGNAELYAADPHGDHTEYFVCIRGENVILETGRSGPSSARNHLRGKVKEISPTGSLVRVVVDVGFEMVALVTHQSLTDMNLEQGAEVSVVFKASAVHLIPRAV